MAKLWAGVTAGETDSLADDFNSSIRFDCRMYRQDIRGSMAHAAMLAARGILTQAEADALTEGLAGILADLDSGALAIDPGAEDIHMFVEQELTGRIGEGGKLFGSVTGKDVSEALKKQNIDIDKKKISIKDTITGTGVYEAVIKVHPAITSTVKVNIVAE